MTAFYPLKTVDLPQTPILEVADAAPSSRPFTGTWEAVQKTALVPTRKKRARTNQSINTRIVAAVRRMDNACILTRCCDNYLKAAHMLARRSSASVIRQHESWWHIRINVDSRLNIHMMGSFEHDLFDADKFALVPVKAIREELVERLSGPGSVSLDTIFPRDREWACCLVTFNGMPKTLTADNHAGDRSIFSRVPSDHPSVSLLLAHYLTCLPLDQEGERGEVEFQPFPARYSHIHPYFLIANALPKFRKALSFLQLTPPQLALFLELEVIQQIWVRKAVSEDAQLSFATTTPPPSDRGDDSGDDNDNTDGNDNAGGNEDFSKDPFAPLPPSKRGQDSASGAPSAKRWKTEDARDTSNDMLLPGSPLWSSTAGGSALFVDTISSRKSEASSSIKSYSMMNTPSFSSSSSNDPSPSFCGDQPTEDVDADILYNDKAIQSWVQAVDLAQPDPVLETRRMSYVLEKPRPPYNGDWHSYPIDISHANGELFSSMDWAMYLYMACLVDRYQ